MKAVSRFAIASQTVWLGDLTDALRRGARVESISTLGGVNMSTGFGGPHAAETSTESAITEVVKTRKASLTGESIDGRTNMGYGTGKLILPA
jgi:hypothetical protein